MKVITKVHVIPKQDLALSSLHDLREYFRTRLSEIFPPFSRIIRFAITKSDDNGYTCEMDGIVPEQGDETLNAENLFENRKRTHENTNAFTTVLLIPTGIGAEIGGHCGDGNTIARLVASATDTLITHPNVVNASDLNEMTENTLYVEGSILTRLMLGRIGLQRSRLNRVLMLMDRHPEGFFNDEVINAVSSARITLGMDCDVYEMDNIIESTSKYSDSGRAVGEINGLENLFSVVGQYKKDYDAVGLSTFIRVPDSFHKDYFAGDTMVNPWGGIEAMLTHSIAEIFHIPCAHSPMMSSSAVYDLEVGVVDPRKAPESASTTYLHCILKGLHRSPRIVGPHEGVTLEDISCLIIPDGCVGLPTLACLENDIPVIAVRENKNVMRNDLSKLPFRKNKLFIVESYLEAVGVMMALKAGVTPAITRRPVSPTAVL